MRTSLLKRHHRTHNEPIHFCGAKKFLRMMGSSLILPSALTGISRTARAQELKTTDITEPIGFDSRRWWVGSTLICDQRVRDRRRSSTHQQYYVEYFGNRQFLVPPIDGMEEFYTTFQNDLAVINGVDMGTNGHEQGTRAAWSGDRSASSFFWCTGSSDTRCHTILRVYQQWWIRYHRWIHPRHSPPIKHHHRARLPQPPRCAIRR